MSDRKTNSRKESGVVCMLIGIEKGYLCNANLDEINT